MKKSQIFILDLIFAIFILVVSLTIFFSYYFFVEYNENVFSINSKVSNILIYTKIDSLNEEYINKFFLEGDIRNPQNNLVKQILEFKGKGEISKSKNLTRDFVEDVIPKNFNIEINLVNQSGYVLNLFNKTIANTNKENSTIKSSTRKKVFVFVNKTEEYGPEIFEVIVWQ